MSSIPEDAYFEILLRVPVKFTFICKCVCKTWYSLISSRNFVRKHLDLSTQKNYCNLLVKGWHEDRSRPCQLYSVSYDSLLSSSRNELEIVELDFLKFYKNPHIASQLIGTCDGLVCMWNLKFRCFYFWNPATKEYKQLPKSPTRYGKSFSADLFAFGYDCILDDYKLVMVMCVNGYTEEDCLVEVYTLGSNSWRISQTIPWRSPLDNQREVLANGAFHWLFETGAQDFSTVLVSFDISGERFKDMQLPKEPPKNNHRCMSLGLSEGCLCVLISVLESFHVWVMNDYGAPESWTKRYTITSESIIHADEEITDLRLIWSFKNGELLFVYGLRRLIFYDPEHGSARNPVITGVKFFSEHLYFESLVSLKSAKYVGRKTRRGINKNLKKNKYLQGDLKLDRRVNVSEYSTLLARGYRLIVGRS